MLRAISSASHVDGAAGRRVHTKRELPMSIVPHPHGKRLCKGRRGGRWSLSVQHAEGGNTDVEKSRSTTEALQKHYRYGTTPPRYYNTTTYQMGAGGPGGGRRTDGRTVGVSRRVCPAIGGSGWWRGVSVGEVSWAGVGRLMCGLQLDGCHEEHRHELHRGIRASPC